MRLKFPARYVPWLWLACGFVVLPLTAYTHLVALAAWIAPVLLLRFARTSTYTRRTLLAVFGAYALAYTVDQIGLPTSGAAGALLGLLTALIAGFIYAVPYAIDRLAGRHLTFWPRLLLFPSAFVTVTWLGSFLRLIGTSGTPAYSQYGVMPLMQFLSVTGMAGITFLIMLFATSVNAAWEGGFKWESIRKPLALVATLMIAVLGFGFVRLGAFGPSGPTVMTATITIDRNVLNSAIGNLNYATFNQSTDAQRAAIRPAFQATLNQMLARTESAFQQGARIVSWQEDSVQVLAEDRQGYIDQASAVAKQYGGYLQISLQVFTRTTSTQYMLDQSVLIGPTGEVLFTYDKTYPVFPGEWLFTQAGPGVLPATSTPYGVVSTYVCNDSQYPALILQAGRSGVDILLGPSHEPDAMWATQDAAQADYRAIENGVSLVRPGGEGLSLITDFNGSIVASQAYTASGGIMLAKIPIHGVTTIYSKIGDLFVYLCVLGLVVFVGLAFAYRREAGTVKRLQTA